MTDRKDSATNNANLKKQSSASVTGRSFAKYFEPSSESQKSRPSSTINNPSVEQSSNKQLGRAHSVGPSKIKINEESKSIQQSAQQKNRVVSASKNPRKISWGMQKVLEFYPHEQNNQSIENSVQASPRDSLILQKNNLQNKEEQEKKNDVDVPISIFKKPNENVEMQDQAVTRLSLIQGRYSNIRVAKEYELPIKSDQSNDDQSKSKSNQDQNMEEINLQIHQQQQQQQQVFQPPLASLQRKSILKPTSSKGAILMGQIFETVKRKSPQQIQEEQQKMNDDPTPRKSDVNNLYDSNQRQQEDILLQNTESYQIISQNLGQTFDLRKSLDQTPKQTILEQKPSNNDIKEVEEKMEIDEEYNQDKLIALIQNKKSSNQDNQPNDDFMNNTKNNENNKTYITDFNNNTINNTTLVSGNRNGQGQDREIKSEYTRHHDELSEFNILPQITLNSSINDIKINQATMQQNNSQPIIEQVQLVEVASQPIFSQQSSDQQKVQVIQQPLLSQQQMTTTVKPVANTSSRTRQSIAETFQRIQQSQLHQQTINQYQNQNQQFQQNNPLLYLNQSSNPIQTLLDQLQIKFKQPSSKFEVIAKLLDMSPQQAQTFYQENQQRQVMVELLYQMHISQALLVVPTTETILMCQEQKEQLQAKLQMLKEQQEKIDKMKINSFNYIKQKQEQIKEIISKKQQIQRFNHLEIDWNNTNQEQMSITMNDILDIQIKQLQEPIKHFKLSLKSQFLEDHNLRDTQRKQNLDLLDHIIHLTMIYLKIKSGLQFDNQRSNINGAGFVQVQGKTSKMIKYIQIWASRLVQTIYFLNEINICDYQFASDNSQIADQILIKVQKLSLSKKVIIQFEMSINLNPKIRADIIIGSIKLMNARNPIQGLGWDQKINDKHLTFKSQLPQLELTIEQELRYILSVLN